MILRQRSIAALLAAQVISTTGAQMTWLALPWFVLVTSGSATRMSVVMAVEFAGVAVFGLPGGKLLARLGARRTMLLADGMRAPLMMLVPVLHWAGLLSFGFLLAIVFVLGAVTAPYFAAQRMIVPEILGEDEHVVTQASALFQSALRVTMLLGPVVAGVLIGMIGAASVLVVDAVTYGVALLLVGAFVPGRPPLVEDGEDRGVLAGIRFLVREPLLRAWNTALVVGDTAWAVFFAAVPVLVVSSFAADARIAGWLFASFGVGALLGNVVSYRVLRRRVDGLTVVAAGVMGQALPLWLLPLPVPAAVLSAALVASGFANGIVNPSLHAITTLRIPPALRPTVMGAAMTVFALAAPVGLFTAGPILDAVGARPVLVAFAATQTVAMATVAVASLRARARDRTVGEVAEATS